MLSPASNAIERRNAPHLGLRPPVVSWGVLLNQAQNVKAVALHPWMLIPAVFVIVSVLAFNLLGDGLRAAADPYASH